MRPCRDARTFRSRRRDLARWAAWRLLLLALLELTTGCSEDGAEKVSELTGTLFDDTIPSPEAAKEAPAEAPPPRAPAAKKRGDLAVYTVLHGGTLLNVANLYKVHHHEIVGLNPKVDPERQLPPASEVVVYRFDGEDSESIGLPHDGQVVGAMPMLDGPGRKITAERWKTWATRSTVLQLDHVLNRWARSDAHAPPILVGNLSARQGGHLRPHQTHQSGRDVDLSYVAKWDGKSAVNWQHVDRNNLDAQRTWRLLKLLVSEAEVERIFIDRSLQRLLLDYARKHGVVRKSRLAHWLEVAKGSRHGGPIVKHVPGHRDHFHVRFACPKNQGRCRS